MDAPERDQQNCRIMSTPPDLIGLPLKKPVREFNKILDIDIRKGLSALAKGIISFGAEEPVSVGKHGVDATQAVRIIRSRPAIIEDPGKLAWLLIYDAMIRGAGMLLREKERQLQVAYNELEDPPLDADLTSGLGAAVEEAFAEFDDTVVTISSTFFDRPKALKLLTAFREPFSVFLQSLGQSEEDADNIARRFPSYFVYGLVQEWREHSTEYAAITEAIDTPFTGAAERDLEWREYRAFLQRQIDEPVFDETFSLRQIYVEPRAYFVRKKKEEDSADYREMLRRGRRQMQQKKRVVASLTEELDGWVGRADSKRAVRVICGGPGIGKSSFTKMFAAKIANDKTVPVLFIPLHRFDLKSDFEESVAAYVRDARILSHNPLDAEVGENRLLLIFDGLDELALQGKTGAAAAKQFVEMVQRRVNTYNMQSCRVQVLISGRNQVIEENEALLRQERQVLHVLPYLIPEDQRNKYVYENEESIAEEYRIERDQREDWWDKYCSHSAVEADGFPRDLQDKQLEEITSQPLLNYLVALSYKAGRINFSEETTLNEIYRDLLKGVYERRYATGGTVQVHPSVEDLREEDFIELLEEVALTAWYRDGRTTSIGAVMDRCEEDTRLRQNFEAFQDTVKDGITQLVLAFFFRQHSGGVDRDKTFEFTHKSFAEYLTARRLVRAVEEISEVYQLDQEGSRLGKNVRECLLDWLKVAGEGLMDAYVHQFIQDEIRLCLEKGSDVGTWQESLVALVNSMLRKDLPVEKMTGVESFGERRRIARDANESLLCILSACAKTTKIVSKVAWPTEYAAYEWVKRMQAQIDRTGRGTWVRSIESLNLSLYGKLSTSKYETRKPSPSNRVLQLGELNLRGANLRNSDLGYSNLTKTELSESDLRSANLASAILTKASLENVNLEGANLKNARLIGAVLSESVLFMANLESADFESSELSHANLMYSNLYQTDMRGVKLAGANLRGADLEDAILVQANLTNAILFRANLQDLDLRGADLRGAKLDAHQLINSRIDERTRLDDGLRKKVERLRTERSDLIETPRNYP